MYMEENNSTYPTLKFRDTGNAQYPYEMFRGTSPTTFDSDGGPYNLGLVWMEKLITDGKIFYCPSNKKVRNLTYDFYSVKGPWPFGFDNADPDQTTPNLVRSGYSYFPQLKETESLTTSVGARIVPKVNPRAPSGTREYSWIAVTPLKITAVDPTRSVIVDQLTSLQRISHKVKGVAGVNAAFADGHVKWQSGNKTEAFDTRMWSAANEGITSINDLRYIQSLWQP
jgi:prepilin-type processing-associated H-X9-DG protein